MHFQWVGWYNVAWKKSFTSFVSRIQPNLTFIKSYCRLVLILSGRLKKSSGPTLRLIVYLIDFRNGTKCRVLLSVVYCFSFRENPYKVYGSDLAGIIITLLSVHILGDSSVFIKCIHSKTEILLRGDDRLSTNSNAVILFFFAEVLSEKKAILSI